MDALKKAEAAKRQAAQAEEPHPADEAPAAPEPGNPLPELPRELSLLDDQFPAPQSVPTASPGAAPPSHGGAASEAQREREAAHNLFAAKRTTSRAPFWIGLSATTLAAIAAIGVWFWWQLKPQPGGLRPGPALAQRATAAPAPSPQPNAPPRAAPTAAAPGAESAAPAQRAESGAPARAMPQKLAPLESKTADARDPTRVGRLAADAPREAAESATAVRAQRGTPAQDPVQPAVARAYAAYSAGDLESAKRHYDEALRADPRSLDALDGMAAVALRAGRRDVAEEYLARALEIDPKDGFALAAMTSLRSRSDAQTGESRFKGLIAAAPDSAAAHFGLGNLYAREGRWAEAQQSYFRAYTSEPDNPDFMFNLAVSLDHLRQPKLAQQYYQQALAAGRPGAFDREQAAARLRELQAGQ